MGVFIQITIEPGQLTPETGKRLVSVCPVDIFALDGDHVMVQADEADECTLCRLCLEAAPAGTLRILKRYSGEILESYGAKSAND